MLGAVQRFVHKRRQSFIQSAVFLYGSYGLSAYVTERLEEMKDRTLRNKLARECLRRRFQSTHDDSCFTIMALIPTLASQILEDMDVEALTNELQSVSRASRSRTLQSSQNQSRSQSISERSSVSDVHSDASVSSYSGSGFDADHASVISGSWVGHVSPSQGPIARQDFPAQLSDSITSASSSRSNNMEASTSSRTRAQLWNEVKILALTRTLTTLYTVTLLSLLTTVQLGILGRSRYIDSVCASDRAERARDDVPHFSVTEVLAREAVGKLVDVGAIWPVWMFGENKYVDEDEKPDTIPEGTELRFLTLSWWLLHVGWKDVAARVRSSVESVFDDVSLKAKLSSSELYTLIMDVRRRVEMNGTGSKLGERFLSSLLPSTPELTAHVLAQGGVLPIPHESRIRDSTEISYNGLSHAPPIPVESPMPRPAVFPTPPSSNAYESDLSSRASQSPPNVSVPHPQAVQSTSTSDSLATSRSTLEIDSQFITLLEQTRLYLSGPDFAHALGCALDRVTEVLMDGLRARVFVDTASAVNVPNAEDAQARSRTEDVDVGADPQNKDHIRIRLAGLLPGLARWCQLALNTTPNELVDNIMSLREVNAMEAIIMSDYQDRFPAVS